MTDKILKKNLETIGQYNPFYLGELTTIDFSSIGNGVVEEHTTQGTQETYFRYNDKKYLLHSRYDKIAEATRIIRNIDIKTDYLIIIFGIGLGHHLIELSKRITPETRVVIIEHNLDVLKYALTHVDFSNVFSSGQFVLLFGDEKQISRMSLALGVLGFYKLIHNTRILSLPNYYVYFEQNKNTIQQINKVLYNVFLSFGNDLEDHFLGFNNMAYNTEKIICGYSLDDITGKYSNVPAIIVASGPSLDKNIHLLKQAEGKALIIACDASMRACDKYDVRPDAVSSIERIEATYQAFYEERSFSQELVLIGPGSLWPDIYREFPGKVITVARNDTGFEQLWLESLENFTFHGVGHSCATVAFAAARQAGCNPIVLIGQDLAYTSGKRHSSLTHYGNRLNDDHEAGGVYVEDYEGNLLKTTGIFRMFKEWYEMQIANDPLTTVINATEGGAYIKGTIPMKLQEVIDTYCHKTVPKRLVEYLPTRIVTEDEKIRKISTLIKAIKRDIKTLNKIKKMASTHQNLLLKLDRMMQSNHDRLIEYVEKMQRGDRIIQQINEAESLSGYYKPIILNTVMNVRKIGNELTIENVRKNLGLQYSLMYMITNSTDLILKQYTTSKVIVEKIHTELGG